MRGSRKLDVKEPMRSATSTRADDFELVYSLNIPNAANYAANPVPYLVDDHLDITGAFDRIAYYVEVMTPGGQLRWVYASMDAFTQDARLIGIPTAANGAYSSATSAT